MSISDGVNRIYEKKMDKNEFVDAVVFMVILVKLNMETGAVGKEGFFFFFLVSQVGKRRLLIIK